MTLEMMIQERVMRGREEEREEMVTILAEFMTAEEIAERRNIPVEKVKEILASKN